LTSELEAIPNSAQNYALYQKADSGKRKAESGKRKAESRKQKAACGLRVNLASPTIRRLLSAFALSAFCFLLSAFCFLLSAFCFLLSRFLPYCSYNGRNLSLLQL
jgi:hypothetical protein